MFLCWFSFFFFNVPPKPMSTSRFAQHIHSMFQIFQTAIKLSLSKKKKLQSFFCLESQYFMEKCDAVKVISHIQLMSPSFACMFYLNPNESYLEPNSVVPRSFFRWILMPQHGKAPRKKGVLWIAYITSHCNPGDCQEHFQGKSETTDHNVLYTGM